MAQTKYDLRTKALQRQLSKLETQLKPLREKQIKVHHKLNISNVKYKNLKGETKTFRSTKQLKRFIKKQKSIIEERIFKSKQRELKKKATIKTRKSLKKLEEEAKKLIKKSKTLKGKRKESTLKKAEEIKNIVKKYKEVKRKNRKVAGLGGKASKIKNTARNIIIKETGGNPIANVWGSWEIAFSDNVWMISAREVLYNNIQNRDNIPLEEIDKLTLLFEKLYEAKEEPLVYDSLLDKIKNQVEHMIYAYVPEMKDETRDPFSDKFIERKEGGLIG